MRLSRIEIENFKGISAKQVIDLRPITLLFGPNSAGKSTILQALHYVREILERGNADPDETIAGGMMDLGGFRALVHGQDVKRAITITLSIDLTGDRGNENLPLNSGAHLHHGDFEYLRILYIAGDNVGPQGSTLLRDVSVSVEVRWSEMLSRAYVSRLDVGFNQVPVASIGSPPQPGRAQLTNLNVFHPLLQEQLDEEDHLSVEDAEQLGLEDAPDDVKIDPISTPLGHLAWTFSRDLVSNEHDSDSTSSPFRLGVVTEVGALPDRRKVLQLDLREPDTDPRRPLDIASYEEASRPGFERIIDEIVMGPVRILRDYLSKTLYVGPLREIPARNYEPRRSHDEARWAHGLAAWDLLYLDATGKLRMEVSDWLENSEKLGAGYRIEVVRHLQVPIPGPFQAFFSRGLTEDDLADLEELFRSLKAQTEIGLFDLKQNIVVAPNDVGVGISQMIPVVVACLHEGPYLVSIEQPELHIHPALQVRMGDLLVHSIKSAGDRVEGHRALLIETHSEHLMLRLLRRIRETSAGELPRGALPLIPEELCVIYVDQATDGVRFRRLRVDSEGEFLDRWPRGFFEERADELF